MALSRPLDRQATPGDDFRLPQDINPATVTFNPSDNRETLRIDIVNDDFIEGDQYFDLKLTIAPGYEVKTSLRTGYDVANIKLISRDGNSGN